MKVSESKMSTSNMALVLGLVLLQAAFIKDAHGQNRACDQMDLCFIADRSGSICDSDPNFSYQRDETCGNWASTVKLINDIVSNMNIGPYNVRVALVTFANSAQVAWSLATYTDKASLLNAINNLQYIKGGTTEITDGIYLANSQVFNTPDDRPNAGNVAIIITDGKSTTPSTVPAALNALHASRCLTLVVGITNHFDMNTIILLSSPPKQPGKTYFVASDSSTVSAMGKSMHDHICPQPDQVHPPRSCTDVQDVVIVLDGSGSICDNDPDFVFARDQTCNNWAFILQFINNLFSDSFIISPVATRVALILFSNDARLMWGLDAYKDKATLLYAINTLQYIKGGTTDTTGALRILNSEVFTPHLTRPNVPKIAIIITDGKPTDPSTVEAASRAVQDSGIQCFVVGVTNQVDDYTLRLLSSPPKTLGATYFIATDFKTIETQVTAQLVAQACPGTLTTEAPKITCSPFQKLDLAFVVDGSGSICGDEYPPPPTCGNWSTTLAFVRSIVQSLAIGPSQTRCGMIIFSSEQSTQVLWDLTTYSTSDDLLRAIDNVKYPGGTTFTAMALNLLRTSMFASQYDRPGVKKTAIIITDGKPTDTTTVPEAIAAVHNAGIKTFAVGITDSIDEPSLRSLSSFPQEKNKNYFMTPDFNSLGPLVHNDLVKETCSE